MVSETPRLGVRKSTEAPCSAAGRAPGGRRMCIRDVTPRVDKSSTLYALRTTHTMSATRSMVPRMPPPMYITISVFRF